MLDTIHSVETPEGVDLALRTAGPVPRLLAWLIDFAIRLGLLISLSVPLGMLGQGGVGISLIVAFGLEWFYPVALEVFDRGRTPGKRALGLRVVRFDGTPVDWTSSVIRNLLRVADFLPLFHLAGLLSMVISGKFRRLGDLAAGTLVIYDEGMARATEVPRVAPVPPSVSLHLDEQRAVVSFSKRVAVLSDARARELAQLATPLLSTPSGVARDAVQHLQGVAAWLTGRRPKERRP